MSSEKLTEPLHQECGKYRAILHSASNADEVVRQKMEEAREAMRILSLPEPELKYYSLACFKEQFLIFKETSR